MKPHHTERKCQASFLLYLTTIHTNYEVICFNNSTALLADITLFLQGYRHVTASSRGRQGDLVSMPTAFTQNGHCFMVQEPLKIELISTRPVGVGGEGRSNDRVKAEQKLRNVKKNACSPTQCLFRRAKNSYGVCVKVSASPHSAIQLQALVHTVKV